MIDWNTAPASALKVRAAEWDSLNSRCGALPFLESRFLLPLLAEFAAGGELLALGSRNGQLVAGVILRRLGGGRWESFQPSQLPLGPVLSDGIDPAELAASLSRRLPGFTLSFALTQLDPNFASRPSDSGALETLDYIQTAWVDIDSDFDTYWNTRGKNLRQNMRKQRKKLEADGIATRLELIDSAGQVTDALASYGKLESAGWKAGNGTAIAADNAQGRFYRSMLENFCNVGRARIYRYWFGDDVVAMDLCIASSDTLVILKTTYDESHRTLSPAFLMREEQFAALFGERRYKRIEFYGKVMDWHRRWTDRERTLYHLNLFRWPLLNRLRKLRSALNKPSPGASENSREATTAEQAG